MSTEVSRPDGPRLILMRVLGGKKKSVWTLFQHHCRPDSHSQSQSLSSSAQGPGQIQYILREGVHLATDICKKWFVTRVVTSV